jgi:hypothetical protein
MIKIKAENARQVYILGMAIAKFSKATAPALAPYPRPAGNAEIGDFGLKLIVHVLIRGSLNY